MKCKYKLKRERKIEKQYKPTIEKYRKDPVLFAEEVLGVKLLEYQKLMLRIMNKKESLLR
jgi:hypothetical protein